MKKSIIILILLVSISLICFNTLAFAATPNFNIKSFIGSCLVKPDGSLWVWGNGQPTPVKIHGLSDVDRAFNEQLVMKKDKTVWYWERDPYSGASQIYQIKPLKGLTDVCSVWGTILALDQEGNVFILPRKEGKTDPSQFDQISPLADIDNVMAISSYEEYRGKGTYIRWSFLKKDGTVWLNKNDDFSKGFVPVQSLENIIAIEQNFALKQDGTVWSWPREFEGNSDEPLVAVPIKELTNISKLRSNGNSYLAIDEDSCLWFWGVTMTGYSDGTNLHYQHQPVKLTTIKNVKDAFVIERSLIVLTNDENAYITSIERKSMPENPVFDLFMSDVNEIYPDFRHLIIQKNNGSMWGWGYNRHGELGIGDLEIMHNMPQQMQPPVEIYLNGELIVMNRGVIIRNGQAFIPLRSIFEKLGATVNWDASSKTVTISKEEADKQPVKIDINYATGKIFMNTESVVLANSPFIVGGTAYLPVRFIGESLGAKVEWFQDETVAISITY